MRKKSWPADALMIVCANAGEENRANMEGVEEVECRDCFQTLHADTKTIRLGEEHPSRQGRPIMFFCMACCITYDPSTITHYADHSLSQDGRKAITAANPQAVDMEAPNTDTKGS